jgi:hypothetical protein
MKSWRVPTRRPLLEELEGRVVPTVTSTNWSGYSVTAPTGTVTSVSATWTVQSFARRATSGYEASWVGIDGFNSPTVEQTGTEADFSNGRANYYAWYEMYPNASVTVPLTIKAGDSITGTTSWASSTTYAGGVYTLSLVNNTSGGTWSTTINETTVFDRSSADFIVEAPSTFFGPLPLDGFGSITFKNAQYALNSGASGPIDQSQSGTAVQQINMVNRSNQLLDTTGALSDASSPSTFTVTRGGSSSSSGGSRNGGGHGGGHFFDTEQAAVSAVSLAAASVPTGGASRLPAPTVSTPAAPTAAVPAAVVATPALTTAGLAAIAGGGGSQSVAVTGAPEQEAVMPEMPPDGGPPAPPADSAKPGAAPDAAPMPAVPADSAVADAVRDTLFTDGRRWAPAAAGDGASLVADTGDDNGGTLPSIAGVLFTLSLGGAVGVAREQVAAERRRRTDLR